MEKYRNRIYRKYKPRRKQTRDDSNGRRLEDSMPHFWTVGFVVQFVTIILTGVFMILCGGCVYIKKIIFGGNI